jgi:hypothetical protein
MKPEPDHEPHISQHYRETLKSILFTPGQMGRVLTVSRFDFDGQQVSIKSGKAIGNLDCDRYRQAVRSILGETCYSLMKAKFTLAGCNCE